jgi:hypothetical protein
MNDIRFVPAVLTIHFETLNDENSEMFRREYTSLSEYEEDAIGQWLKIAKARGETKETDEVLLNLLVELHKKVDELTALVKNEEKKLLTLAHTTDILEIGFEYFRIEKPLFIPGKEYYARIEMPIFPKREMAVYLKGIDANIAEIILMHDKDMKDWNAYVVAKERVMIRELKKGKSDG